MALASIFALAACSPQSATDERPSSTPDSSGEASAPNGVGEPSVPSPAAPAVIAAGLDAPWSVAFYKGTALVSERDSARILELAEDGSTREIALIDEASPGGEGGLLGIAVHDGYLYAYLTADDENRIERFALTGAPGNLALGAAQTLLDGIPSANIHNGGRLKFGPDGMLYASTGDASHRPNAQDLSSLGGKILRMTPTGQTPNDNPVSDSYVYSYGHRNVQGLAWSDDGTMYATEFGQDTWDELNVIEPGGNYGWPEVEGMAGEDAFIDPVQQWRPTEASPSGMAIVDGSIYIANLRGERLREVPLDDIAASTDHLVGEYGRLRDAVVAPDGALWIVTNNTDGRGDPGPDDDRIIAFTTLP